MKHTHLFSSPEPKGLSRRPSMRACVRECVMNISETNGPIAFYLNHHWGGGKPALGFWLDQIRNLVSMPTDSSHRIDY